MTASHALTEWNAETFLHGFDGALQLDGDQGYNRPTRPSRKGGDPIRVAHCWTHASRHECFCVEGEGIIKDMATGEEHPLREGVMYALDKNDKHRIIAVKDIRLVSVFTPALQGHESHNLAKAGASTY